MAVAAVLYIYWRSPFNRQFVGDEAVDSFRFIYSISQKAFQNSDMNYGPRSDTIVSGVPVLSEHLINEQLRSLFRSDRTVAWDRDYSFAEAVHHHHNLVKTAFILRK